MRCGVAGVTFDDRQDIIRKHAQVGSPIFLVAEPTNEYDKNAVKVLLEDTAENKTYHIGYLPKHVAAYVRPFMSDDEDYPGVVITVKGGDDFNVGLVIEFDLGDPLSLDT